MFRHADSQQHHKLKKDKNASGEKKKKPSYFWPLFLNIDWSIDSIIEVDILKAAVGFQSGISKHVWSV